jgi:hypothetical protein
MTERGQISATRSLTRPELNLMACAVAPQPLLDSEVLDLPRQVDKRSSSTVRSRRGSSDCTVVPGTVRTPEGRILEAALSQDDVDSLEIDHPLNTVGCYARVLLLLLVKGGHVALVDLRAKKKSI